MGGAGGFVVSDGILPNLLRPEQGRPEPVPEISVQPFQSEPEQVRDFVDGIVGLIVEGIIEEGKRRRKEEERT